MARTTFLCCEFLNSVAQFLSTLINLVRIRKYLDVLKPGRALQPVVNNLLRVKAADSNGPGLNCFFTAPARAFHDSPVVYGMLLANPILSTSCR